MAKQVTLKKVDGRLFFSEELSPIFDFLSNGDYVITIKRANKKRTIPQNDLMWMWFAHIERETATDKNDIYMYYCKKFLGKTIQVGNRMERIYTTSSNLNTEQMSEFMNKIQADAATEFGIRLPQPEDRFFEAFYSQYNY